MVGLEVSIGDHSVLDIVACRVSYIRIQEHAAHPHTRIKDHLCDAYTLKAGDAGEESDPPLSDIKSAQATTS